MSTSEKMDQKTLDQIKSQVPNPKVPSLVLNTDHKVKNGGVNMSQNTE